MLRPCHYEHLYSPRMVEEIKEEEKLEHHYLMRNIISDTV